MAALGALLPILVWLAGAQQGAALEYSPSQSAGSPRLIPLRRESIPVYRKGKVVSYKATYSGTINAGSPAREFSMVFDTGSSMVVLPQSTCKSESCLVHRRFDSDASSTAQVINIDGSEVQPDWTREKVKIAFGTGQVVGELAKDTICLGRAQQSARPLRATASLRGAPALAALRQNSSVASSSADAPLCTEVNFVMATEMSARPFKDFAFDGIFGLSLDALALNPQFSAFSSFVSAGLLPVPHFSFFLGEEEDGEDNELAIGGHNPSRLLEPLSWTPVVRPEMGHWQVQILAVRVNGVELDVCKDGTCRAIVDTGSSHLGIPAPYDAELSGLLSVAAGDLQDCRDAEAPEVEIELPGRRLSLQPSNYMRRVPQEGTATEGSGATSHCSARLMPVKMTEPMGPKLFILGEPVMQRYYTVFDWEAKRVGFGLANNQRNVLQK